MNLTVLGSGSTVPHSRRSSAAFWIETSGGSILLDCAATAPMRMAHEGLHWAELDAVWISHFHLDHCGGLAPMLAGTKHAPTMKERKKPLNIFGPEGLKRLIDGFDAVNNYRLLEQPFPVEIVEIKELEPFEMVARIEAVAMSTPHTDESHAIHIRDGEQTFVYTSDTGFSPHISTFANQVDLLLMECTFVKNKPVEKHLELAEAMHILRKAKPKRAMLTHFYPEWDAVDFDVEVKRLSPPCEVIEATDGLRVSVART